MYAKESKRIHRRKFFCFLFLAFALLINLSDPQGKYGISSLFKVLLSKLSGKNFSEEAKSIEIILIQVRIPRILTASLFSAAIGVAGVLSQGLFRNPLGSPSLVGSTSGALLGAIFCFYLGEAFAHSLQVTLFASLGSLLSTFFILLLYNRIPSKSISKLLLMGLSFTTFSNALGSFLISLEDKDIYKSSSIYRWLLGGFHSVEWSFLKLSVIPLLFGIAYTLKFSYQLDLLSLGEETAGSLGVNMRRLKTNCLLILSLLLGVVTSFVGPLPFVGLIVPHITRSLLGPKHKTLMLYTMINSMSLVLLADYIAKNLLSHKELEISILLSLIGAPFFLYLLFQERRL